VVCGDTPSVTELVDYLEFCGVSSADDKLSLNKVSHVFMLVNCFLFFGFLFFL